jgi:DNA repair exonuclease SbcCD nuclease subunit
MRITRFNPETSNRIREARLIALDNILKKATELRVNFLLIAGDLFDDLEVDRTTARRAFMMLEGAPLPVYVLPGNHDPLVAGGVWDRPPWDKLTGTGLHLFRECKPLQVEPGLVLLPCPVFRRTSLNDPTGWMAECTPSDSDIRIGIAHGSLRVRDDLPADDHLIARHAVSDHRLDYLALGHWHSRRSYPDREGVERITYPGVHEPMRFPGSFDSRTGWIPPYGGSGRQEFVDSGKGEVIHVRIRAKRSAPEIEAVETNHLIWQEEKWELSSEEDLARLIQEVATRPDFDRRLLRLELTGTLNAEAMLRLDELREILTNRYFFGEIDDAQLHIQPTDRRSMR